MNETHLQSARANRILQDATGHHLRLHRRLVELGGTAARRETPAAPAAADDHELMGEFDQDVADAVPAGSRTAKMSEEVRRRLVTGIRGSGPISPMAARSRGYRENTARSVAS